MFKSRIIIFYVCLSFLLIPGANLKSQVTIGSRERPNEGALLDLKEFSPSVDGGANSTRGLGMPRVTLNDSHDLDVLDIDPNLDKTLYAGMMVYHFSNNDVCPILPYGLYVWDGDEWQSLQANASSPISDQTSWIDNGDGTGILTDYEGNSYRTKDFDGVVWMVDNLRSIIASTGEAIDNVKGVRLNPGFRVTSSDAVGIAINCKARLDETPVPIKIGGVDPNLTYITYANAFGLLYTQAQSLRACPRGWSLSTDAQWTALRAFLGGAGAGKKIKLNDLSYTPVENTGFFWQGYAPGNINNVGFNAVPSGYVNLSNEAVNFSYGAYYWTPTSQKYYYLYYVNTDIQTVTTANENLSLSVRCVKD